ncbi:hypothetical protein ANCCAN_22987 [Ancylostoma caninum]|uniref:Minichromosome loss protein Mcl1 middle region domain-containing protein n=1 Tax=Ancylostoma caninum TaxID=29170 RepID=A0A368FI72_ANCCA|nr:hypothetical protein ANCCAN_22987 [Ancylostoma caninum]
MSFTDIRNVHVKGHITICTDRAGSSDKVVEAFLFIFSQQNCQIFYIAYCWAAVLSSTNFNVPVTAALLEFRANVECSMNFLTCGTEGTVYVWDEKTVNERESIDIKTVADGTNSCCAWNGQNVFVGMTTTDLLTGVDKKIVGQCSLDDLESCRQLFTFSLEVTSVDASENYVVAGGSDFTVKKVNLKKQVQYDRIDTNGEVLSVAIDPKEEVYAVACCDGTVSIHNLESNEKVAFLEYVFPAFGEMSFDTSRHSLTWSKDGSELFVPSQGCVKVVKRANWEFDTSNFKSNGTAMETFSSSSLSKCGRFLCSSTLSNKIVVWNVNGRSVLAQYDYNRKDKKSIISCIKFSPFNDKDVIVVDVDEGLCVLKNAIPQSALGVEPSNEAAKATGSNDQGMDSGSDEDDIEDADSRSSRKGGFIDDEADEDGDTRLSVDIGAIKKKYGFGDDTTGKLEDYGFTASDEAPTRSLPPTSFEPSVAHVAPPPPEVIAYKPPTIPAFFVSGASPDHLTQRYLKWNSYGIIRTYSGEDGSSVEISFHDVSIHPTIVLDNGTTEYVLADLSDQAVALASKAEEKGEQSHGKAKCKNFQSYGYSATHNLSPKSGELSTYLGPVLTTACYGSRIAICSITGGDYYEKGKDQQPHFQHTVSVYDADSRQWYRNKSNVTTVNVPVGKKEHLLWLAYTNCGQLVSMDSSYTIRLLSPSGFWMPIFDGSSETSSKSDAIWPIAVTEGRQKQIRYLYCKGSKHPLVAVKMAPLIAPWAMPYCAPESDKSKLEQDLFLNELQQSEAICSGSSSELVELASGHLQSLVKLFALACKSERDGRAAELAGLVASAKGIQMMCNYAAKLKKSTLADKVAAKGRENVSLNESSMSSSFIGGSQEDPAPRRISLKRKTGVMHQRPLFMEDDAVTSTVSGSNSDDEVAESQPQAAGLGQEASESLLNDSTVVPLPKLTRNPFKRSPSASLDTSSVFDGDSSFSSVNRKRTREEEPIKQSTSKQAKLSFGSATGKGKENGKTAYSLWMESQEEVLRGMFSGNPDDFLKFCAQQFRMLPAAEKKPAVGSLVLITSPSSSHISHLLWSNGTDHSILNLLSCN